MLVQIFLLCKPAPIIAMIITGKLHIELKHLIRIPDSSKTCRKCFHLIRIPACLDNLDTIFTGNHRILVFLPVTIFIRHNPYNQIITQLLGSL